MIEISHVFLNSMLSYKAPPGSLTKLWCASVELLGQKAVISETLHRVSHRDDGHHHQPAPQDVQETTHLCRLRPTCQAGEVSPLGAGGTTSN